MVRKAKKWVNEGWEGQRAVNVRLGGQKLGDFGVRRAKNGQFCAGKCEKWGNVGLEI